jgi:hypothetical protein
MAVSKDGAVLDLLGDDKHGVGDSGDNCNL